MDPVIHPRHGERGMALVMALLVLLVLSLLGAVLMATVGAERRVAARSVREGEAFAVAEAGVDEALTRIKNGEIENNGANPRMVAQIFNAPSGSVPALGADSTALATGQPAGQWLAYSTGTKGPDVLTVQYKTDPAKTVVYRYDRNLASPIQTASGYPIFVVTSTGRVGPDRTRVTGEYIQKPYIARANAAITADVGIHFKGTADVCGYNHRMDTPTGTAGVHPGGACAAWWAGGNDLPGAWSTDDVTKQGASQQGGSPAYVEHQTGFYAGPWEVLGMSQAEFFSWVGAPINSVPAQPRGIYYFDNNTVVQDQSGGPYGFNGGDGEGFLYIDGDASINGNFTFRGLVYIEGDLQINGTCWILGGIICKGVSDIDVANGTCRILYSKDAIEQNISKYGGQFVRLSWLQQ
jgi:Tfp pilus assembly protein PilX